MALIACPECEREISENAKNCPHCGFPLHKKEISNNEPYNKKIYVSLLLGIGPILTALILGLLGFSFEPKTLRTFDILSICIAIFGLAFAGSAKKGRRGLLVPIAIAINMITILLSVFDFASR